MMNKIKKIIPPFLILALLVSLIWVSYRLIQKQTSKQLKGLDQEAATTEGTGVDLQKRDFEISNKAQVEKEAGFYLKAEKDTVLLGENFNLEVWVNGQNQEVDGAEFVLDFDPSFVEVEEPELGAFFSLYPFKKIDNQSGEIRVVALQDMDESKKLGEEIVVILPVTVLQKGKVDFSFDLEKTHIACCAGQELLKEALPLTITAD